jgi:hypothetical protein
MNATSAPQVPRIPGAKSPTRRLILNQPARYDHPRDPVRALENLVDAQIAHDLLNAVVGEIALPMTSTVIAAPLNDAGIATNRLYLLPRVRW